MEPSEKDWYFDCLVLAKELVTESEIVIPANNLGKTVVEVADALFEALNKKD